MRPVSAAFMAAARSSNQRATARAEIRTRAGQTLATLQPISGSVSIDATRSIRRSLTATLVDPDGTLTATSAKSLLAPVGNEIVAWRGFVLDDGTTEDVQLGVFGIANPVISEDDSGVTIQVTAYDRSRAIGRATWARPYVMPGGYSLEDTIHNALLDRAPWVEVDFPATGVSLATWRVVDDTQTNPWDELVDVAKTHGWDLFIDAFGIARLRELATTSTTPVATYTDGVDAVILDAERDLSDEDTYSGVKVTGEGPDLATPVTSILWDTDPDSPTYVGTYGERPYPYSSPLITTQAQGDATAASLLPTVTGITERVAWTQVVNPALEDSDALAIGRPRIGVSTVVVLESLEIPFGMTEASPAKAKAVKVWTV